MNVGGRSLAEMTGTVAVVAGLLALGFWTGPEVWILVMVVDPLFVRVHFFEGALSAGLFSAVIGVTGLLLTYEVWHGGSDSERVTSGPRVQAIVPAYRDASVVHKSVTSLLESEYERLDIAVVVEPDDERTRRTAEGLADRHDAVECLVNDAPGSKATGINCAVAHSDADYFVVFDADEEASPEFVPVAMSELRGGADVFQGRRVPRPTGPVETLAYCERIVVQAGYRLGELVGFTHCQSSATGFTREAFEAVDGYADVLTEDIYFSHQCHRAGLTVTRNRRCTSSMEAPHTLRDLWGQRKRWRIGHVQVTHMRIREALRGDLGVSDLVTLGRAIGAVLGGAALVVLAAQVLFLFLIDTSSALIPFACIFGMICGVWSRDAYEGRAGRPAWTVLLAPSVYLGHGVLTVKAVLEYALTWEGEWYRVDKTGT